jgi:hypothetical protein
MNQNIEIKYKRFPIQFGERLIDVPAFQRWRDSGWRVSWSYMNFEDGVRYVETLLKRPHETQRARHAAMGASSSMDAV